MFPPCMKSAHRRAEILFHPCIQKQFRHADLVVLISRVSMPQRGRLSSLSSLRHSSSSNTTLHVFKISTLWIPGILVTNMSVCSRSGGFCAEEFETPTEKTLCSDCYMRKVQLEVDEPLALIKNYSPEEFNDLKQSCGIPTSSYPVKATEPTSTPTPLYVPNYP